MLLSEFALLESGKLLIFSIRPTIRWAQAAFSIHMPYLSSLPNLEKEVGGLISWLRARVGHHRELLSLHGKISTIADLIKRRTNNVVIAQQPLIVFNNDLDSDSEDFDTIASDDDGESSEDDWWEDNELKDDENQEEDEDDEGSDSEMDADSAESAGSDGSDDSDVRQKPEASVLFKSGLIRIDNQVFFLDHQILVWNPCFIRLAESGLSISDPY